jgi:hypothetical protein
MPVQLRTTNSFYFLKVAVPGAGVADGAYGFGFDQEGVVFAVFIDFFDFDKVALSFAFMPHFLAAAAEKPDIRPFQREFEGFFVHVAEHQDFVGVDVLDDGGDEAFRIVVEVFLFIFHFIDSEQDILII